MACWRGRLRRSSESTRIVSRMITFDTYAWIEYFMGSEKGRQVSHYVNSDDPIFTPTICLAELMVKFLRDGVPETNRKKTIERVRKRSMLMQLDDVIALKAAELKNEGLPLVDAVVYATALQNKTQLLTGDKHFESYPEVVFLK